MIRKYGKLLGLVLGCASIAPVCAMMGNEVDHYGKSIKFKSVFYINNSDEINFALQSLQRSDHYSTLDLNFVFDNFLPTEEQLEELFKKYPNAKLQIELTKGYIRQKSIPAVNKVIKRSDYLESSPEIWGKIFYYTDRQGTLNLKLCSKYFRDIVDNYGKSIKFKSVFDINGPDKIKFALQFLQRSDHYSTLYINFVFNDFLPTEEQLEELFKKYLNAQFQIALTKDDILYTSIPNFYNRTVNKVIIQYNKALANKLLSINPVDNTALSSNFLTTALLSNTLIELTLAQTYLASSQIITLANILKENTSLTKLNLDHNNIRAAGANAISEALKVNKSLTTLNLHGNKIGADGAKAVSEVLKKNTSLTTLDLRANQIGADEAKAVSEALKLNKSLATLYLGYNNIGDDGAKAVSAALKLNTSLTTLYLDENRIGAVGANAISEALKLNKSLATLDLRDNQIGTLGANAISEALKLNTSLTKLNLDYNEICNAGGSNLILALKANTSLIELNLGANFLSDSTMSDLRAALELNKSKAAKP